MERIALFPGSFNPFTKGHADIVSRALTMFDKVIIGIGINSEKPQEGIAENLSNIEANYINEPRVKVLTYDTLTADVVKKENAIAQYRLGYCYEIGNGVKKNNERAAPTSHALFRPRILLPNRYRRAQTKNL